MKEAFWGVLIVVLGLFGIVVVNLFQNVTIDNDRVYYLIKESTEASAYDAIDLTYYRLSGNLRMVEDKFIENLTRRFAQNVTVGDYRIVVEDLNEVPPKVSLRIRSGVTSLRGEEFGLVNRVDGIIETKYNLEEVLEFLCEDKTTEECDEIKNNFNTKVEIDASTGENINICKTDTTGDDMECIPGDLKFIGWGSHDLPSSMCQDESAPRNKEKIAKYKVCECGKWSEEKTERVIANPVSNGNEYTYTWVFNKHTEARELNESTVGRIRKNICTTNINIMVPNNPETLSPNGNPNEPSSDNSNYILCPTGGIRIPSGTKVVLHPQYIPANAINRNLIWTSSNTSALQIISSNPWSSCELNSNNSNCFSKATITAQNVDVETESIVTVKTTRNQTATCKVKVWDGRVSTVSCNDLKLKVGENNVITSSYSPTNATLTTRTYSISDSSIATIDSSTGAVTAKRPGTATVTVTMPKGISNTCTLRVEAQPAGDTLTPTSGNCPSVTLDDLVEKETSCRNDDYMACYNSNCERGSGSSYERYYGLCVNSVCGCNEDSEYTSGYVKEATTYNNGKRYKKTTRGECNDGSRIVYVYDACIYDRYRNTYGRPTYSKIFSTNQYNEYC